MRIPDKHITGFRKRFIISELAMRMITSLVGLPIVVGCLFIPREAGWAVPGDIVWAIFVSLAAFLKHDIRAAQPRFAC